MTRVVLGIIVSGAAATLALVVGSLLAALAWRCGADRAMRFSPRGRADVLAAWRLFPVAASCTSAALTLFAFLEFEPLDAQETLGVILPAICATGLICLATGVLRGARAMAHTARTVRAWGAERAGFARMLPVLAVDAPFPVVAVVGIWRPRLLVARQVVASCDCGELDAMIAHEMAHIEARDNLTRLLFAGAPVVPFVSRTLADIERTWIAASEEAADDVARRDVRSALALASALTKVARMATGRAPLVHASAILSGSSVEHRVRRLLGAAPVARHYRRGFVWAGAMLGATGAVLWQPVVRSAYDMAEYCIRHLP